MRKSTNVLEIWKISTSTDIPFPTDKFHASETLDTPPIKDQIEGMRPRGVFHILAACAATAFNCTSAFSVTLQDCGGMSRALQRFNSDQSTSEDLVRALREGDWVAVRYSLICGAAHSSAMTPRERSITQRLRNSLALIPLAAAGNDAEIERRLAHRADPSIHVEVDDYMTPLAWAAKCSHPSTISLLLANGAPVDQRFGYAISIRVGILHDSTALFEASRWGSGAAARELLRRGADPNARDRYVRLNGTETAGAPPIMYAANNEILEMLLEAGADPNLADGGMETALLYAVRRGDRRAVQILLAHGADPTIRSVGGDSAMSVAQRRGRRDILSMLGRADAPRPP